MFALDSRDYDSRDGERQRGEPIRGRGRGSDPHDRDDKCRQSAIEPRQRDDDDARTLGRGPGSDRQGSQPEEWERDRRDDARWPERDREHDRDARNTFTQHVHLPRGSERQIVRDRDREYTLRGSESRTLATVGAFRVVSSRDLRDHDARPADPRSGDLRHLRDQGLIQTVRVPGYRDHAVVLTKEGRSLLEGHRDRDQEHHQTFYAGLKRERELEHDVQVYRAYEREAERLEARGARIERVVLDYELKREYQSWLHERDRDHDDYDGHPDRTSEEIARWAQERDLPYFDDEIHIPDVRIEYQEPDGRWEREDIEVVTPHYRGAHAASVARAGFTCYRGSSIGIGGRSGGGRRGGRLGGLAEEFWY
jgi:hypothetical protein